ncbi:hypothetical protein ABMA28_004044 [Loxostege sticticalis]|uniref:Reverse transcriptase domain-containing protein n=1 Tax=Loxostege sticticalis TaxID=481309 RepID=A0ABD0STZ9_LOXSC
MDITPEDVYELTDCVDINQFLDKIPNNVELLCIHMNIRSVIKNFESLEQCIMSSSRAIDVIMLTEVNLSYSLSNIYQIKGYMMYTELRKSKKGGGIIIYIKNKHKFNIKHYKTQYCESLLGTIHTPTRYSAVLCCIYRPPSSSKHLFVKELDTLLCKIPRLEDLYILGDINIDLRSSRPIKEIYNTTMYTHGLVCGINEYTRIELTKNGLSKSCIDHIYARPRSLDVYTAALGTALADHRTVALAVTTIMNRSTREDSKYIKRYDHKKLIKSLNEIDWKPAKITICPYKIYKCIINNIQKCYENSTVKVKTSINKNRYNNTWINNKILKACEYRDKLFQNWIGDPSNRILKQQYNSSRNYANKLIRNFKNQKLRQDITNSKNNPRALWQILNELTGRTKTLADTIIINALEKNNTSITDIAENFALCFKNSVKDMPNCNIKLLNRETYADVPKVSCRFQKLTSKSALKEIRSINTNKAPGIDRIRAQDLKAIGTKIADVIAHFINESVRQGKYPNELKTGIVRPIHKKGSQNIYENYRPITILSAIDKIVEKAIAKQINTFYSNNNIITNKQYGFQPKKSTTQLLSQFTDSIYKHLNDKKHILIVFIDYSKAFDTLKHDTLLAKLNDCGIQGPLNKWCKNYLEERSYVVKIRDTLSLVLNADKTKLMYVCSSQNRKSHSLKLIAHNHNCLHSDLTNCSCAPVEVVSQQKYLGLVIDSRLKWTEHINHVCDKLRAMLAKFRLALVETTIHYGLSSYGRTSKSHLDQIYNLQVRFLKTIVPDKIKNKYKNNYHQLFYHCNTIPIYDKVKYILLCDHFFNDSFKTFVYRCNKTRSASNTILNLPSYNNLYGKAMLQYQIPKLINELPATVKSQISNQNIKNKLKQHYLSLVLLA